MNLYSISVDLILIAVFAYTVYRSYKRGFVDAVSGLLSLIGAFLAANMFGFVLEGLLYREVIAPLVTEAVGGALTDAAASVSTSLSDALAALGAQAERLTHTAQGLGIRIPLESVLPQSVADTAALGALTEEMTASASQPIAQALSHAAAFVILFVLSYLLLRIVFRALDLVMRLPILRTVNRAAGGLCGVLVGAGYAFLCAQLLSLVLGILVTDGTFPPEILDGRIFGFLTGTVNIL